MLRSASLKRLVKLAAQITNVNSSVPPRIAAAPRVTRSAYKIVAFSFSSNNGLRS